MDQVLRLPITCPTWLKASNLMVQHLPLQAMDCLQPHMCLGGVCFLPCTDTSLNLSKRWSIKSSAKLSQGLLDTCAGLGGFSGIWAFGAAGDHFKGPWPSSRVGISSRGPHQGRWYWRSLFFHHAGRKTHMIFIDHTSTLNGACKIIGSQCNSYNMAAINLCANAITFWILRDSKLILFGYFFLYTH